MILLGETDGSRLCECADRVLGGFSGQQDAQRRQNQGYWLICAKTLALKEKICC